MNVLLLLAFPPAIAEEYRRRLQDPFPDVTINLVGSHGDVDPYIGDADVLITFGAHMADHVLEKGTRLRWIQLLGTGVDGVMDSPALRDGVIVTNLRGLHGAPVSEAVLAAMLALARDLPRTLANQRESRWQRFPSRLLKGSTVVILGVGVIAEELAPKCQALGMRVVGISSTPRRTAGFDEMVSRDRLLDAVAEADHLVLLAPYTAETRGMVDGRVLAAMKPTSVLINVARGGLIDEPALVEALREHRIAGAALDVFSEEPLPPDHVLWSLDNVLLTPHTAGFHVGYANDALPIVEDNLHRYLAGATTTLINVVRP